MSYVANILFALDQFANAIAGGAPYETVSLRAARARDAGKVWGCVLCSLLGLIVKDHCTKAELNERAMGTREARQAVSALP